MDRTSKPAIGTFALPIDDSQRIERLRVALAKRGHLLNRSEVVRLGLLALEGLSGERTNTLVAKLERRRPGRKPR